MRSVVFVVLLSITVALCLVSCGCLELNPSDGGVEKVSNLELEATTVYIGLSWDPVDGADFYRILRDGVIVTETAQPFYNDSDLVEGVEYTYRVSAGETLPPAGALLGGPSDPVTGMLVPMEYDDDGFRRFALDTGRYIQGILYDINEAAGTTDLGALESLGVHLEESASDYLDRLDQFTISVSLQPAMDEYELAMQDFLLAGQHISHGADHLDQGEIEEGAVYAQSGAAHLQNAADLM